MIDRNYVLDIVKSRDITVGEFNYDKLFCPPIKFFFGDYDLQRLYELATSLRYSARPQVKYQEIDLIMKSRGFSKLSAGTNRVVYKCIDDDRFVAKVAVDAVGISDNPREYMNQFELKPFCAKTFEVSPNGVLAFSERLNPITNREQFLSIAEDVFTLLSEFIIDGTRVLDDCGTKFFMNYGLRNGWGPCLLDYTYLYKLDGNKLFCNRPDKTSEIGICGGELDYDYGYNNIVCKKCGAIYRAKDLELKIKENKIIIKSLEGEYGKMKVSIKGRSKNCDVSTIIETKEVNEPIVSDPLVYTDKKRSISISLGHNDEKKDVIITNNKIEKKEETTVAAPVVEEVKEDTSKKKKSSKKTTEDKKDLNSPLKVGDENKNANDIIRDAFLEVGKLISENNIKKKINTEYIDAIISGIKFIVDTARVADGWDTSFEHKLFDVVVNGKNINFENDIVVDNNNIISVVKFLATVADTTDEFSRLVTEEPLNIKEVKEDSSTIVENNEEPAKEIEVINNDKDNNTEEESEEYYYEDDEVVAYEDYDEIQMTGFVAFSAKIIDISSKLTNEESKNVILIEDGEGGFLTVGAGDKYLAIDNIDNINVAEAKVVSKQFIDNILNEIEEKSVELTEDTFKPEDSQVKTVNGVQIKEK